MTKYEELRNQLTIAMVQLHEAKLGEAHDTDFYVDHILSIIAEKCWLKDKNNEMPKNPYTPESSLASAWAGYANAQQTLLELGWRPVKEIGGNDYLS